MGDGGENDGNHKMVDGWHTCHMCLETFGILLFRFKYHFPYTLYMQRHFVKLLLLQSLQLFFYFC